MHDPISDFVNKLKIASAHRQPSFRFPSSRVVAAIADMLKTKGYLSGVAKKGRNGRYLELALLYDGTLPKIHTVRRISRPSKRIYRQARELWPVRSGFGMTVLSTPRGILSDADARKSRVGGEVMFEIW